MLCCNCPATGSAHSEMMTVLSPIAIETGRASSRERGAALIEQCFRVLNVTPKEWQPAHSRKDQFVVWPGQVFPEVEMVVD